MGYNWEKLAFFSDMAGEYESKYQDYGDFFRQLGEINHNSCLILNSWETPQQILTLAHDLNFVSLLELKGLGDDAKAILQEKELQDEDTWEKLIEIYGGNPHWLKLVAMMIKDLCDGKVKECWQYQKTLLPDSLITIINQQIQRLSPLE